MAILSNKKYIELNGIAVGNIIRFKTDIVTSQTRIEKGTLAYISSVKVFDEFCNVIITFFCDGSKKEFTILFEGDKTIWCSDYGWRSDSEKIKFDADSIEIMSTENITLYDTIKKISAVHEKESLIIDKLNLVDNVLKFGVPILIFLITFILQMKSVWLRTDDNGGDFFLAVLFILFITFAVGGLISVGLSKLIYIYFFKNDIDELHKEAEPFQEVLTELDAESVEQENIGKELA